MATYKVDPVNGNDENNGSTWALAFKTINKAFSAGDIIDVAKCVETAQAGTVTGTLGSATINTTDNLTAVCPQYSIIRLDTDPTLYMVKAISASAITLHRPYRGVTGSGKTINLLALGVAASDKWKPVSGDGVAGNLITLRGGVDPATDIQDGFTIINGNNASEGAFYKSVSFWNIQRLGMYYFGYPWDVTNFTNCIIDDCFAFRAEGYSWLALTRSVMNRFVGEIARIRITLIDSEASDFESGESTGSIPGLVIQLLIDSILKNFRNAGTSGSTIPAIRMENRAINSWIVNPVFDELATGCVGIQPYSYPTYLFDVRVINPTFGTGTIFDNYIGQGKMTFENINGLADHCTYMMAGENRKHITLTNDATVYRTAAPSAKITFVENPVNHFTITHLIPCDAGVAKTISVYFRKNSSYGSSTRPIMRLRWLTGSEGALVSNVHDEVMSDTNDTFVQVSYAVTPSVIGSITMELIFQSAASGALAWYDDIGVA